MNSDLTSKGSLQDDNSQSVPLSDIAITVNGCSDDGSDGKDQNVPLLRINNPGGVFLKPWGNNHQRK
jgi:hypothetical protein